MLQSRFLYKLNIAYSVNFLFLLVMATGAPLLGFHSQWVTGPIVNAALILSVYLVGVRGALLIGILPSTIALDTGLLPAVLAPMIPFIIISNTILVLVLDGFKRSEKANYWLGLFFASALKYLFLLVTSGVVIKLLLKQSLAVKVAQMMSWPQFFTALLGGVLAWLALKLLRRF
jgi:hypothetical protein